ncbi:RDD family protein [Novosphingopyxis sp. YJ-S2-01]|uniref:RDD family protein n=1 Tax=Novosphingopyxis sp. YJ-S2-01 TaxID=2794021 RepID=UPI001E5FB63F|nr:RDD family protein [Novosphingopyxis sp. YJ-S2-01]
MRDGAMARKRRRSSSVRRRRDLVTPEGVPLGVVIAPASARLIALILDFAIIGLVLAALFALLALAVGTFGAGAMEPVVIAVALGGFAFRMVYFIAMEARPKAATWGKRIMGMRVVSRDGGPLSIDQVIARNLMREVEVFLPFMIIASMAATGDANGWAVLAALLWALGFSFFLKLNRDRMRIGDLLAGTWVVERPRKKREADLAEERAVQYEFTEAALDSYGIHELHKLEDVLRIGDERAERTVADAIARRIGYDGPMPDDRQFLTDYYRGLRAHLEREVLLGTRRQDKHDV